MAVTHEREITHIDRSSWGEGPWSDDPLDKVQWTDEATGLPCLAVRNQSSGAWCGYVGVDESHPGFGMGYQVADARLGPDGEGGWAAFSVHGGLTFSGPCREGQEDTGICHVPQPGTTDKVWWFGFDCAHAGDICPSYQRLMEKVGMSSLPERMRPVYRPLSYVQGECARLAKQLHEARARGA